MTRLLFALSGILLALTVSFGLLQFRELGVAHAGETAEITPPPIEDTRAPGPAIAPTPPPDIETDPGGFLRYGYEAATSGAWKAFAGVVLLALAWALRKYALGSVAWFQTRLGGFVLAFGIALAGTYGLAFATGAAITALLALDAFVTAAAAAGLWQWLQLAGRKT